MAISNYELTYLYDPGYDDVMLQGFDEPTMKYNKVCRVKDIKNRKEWKLASITTLGRWQRTNAGGAVNQDDPVKMYEKTILPIKYTQSLEIDFEDVEDVESKNAAILDKMDDAKIIGSGGRSLVESKAAGFFGNGFDTTVVGDSEYLFSTSHPQSRAVTGTTYSNKMTTALTYAGIEEMRKLISANTRNGKGEIFEFPDKPILLIPEALEETAYQLVNPMATEKPDTAERNINYFKNWADIVSWRYLDEISTTAWFVIYKSMAPCFGWWRRPRFNSWVEPKTEQYIWAGTLRAEIGAADWYGCWGSTGVT